MRRILVTHRTVPLDRSEEYWAAWKGLAGVVAGRSGRAWVFRRAGHEDRFVEFLEWQDPTDLPDSAEVAEALRVLDGIASGSDEELEEAV